MLCNSSLDHALCIYNRPLSAHVPLLEMFNDMRVKFSNRYI